MRTSIYVAVAVALGIAVMLVPLLAFTNYGYHSVIDQIKAEQSSFNTTENDKRYANIVPFGRNDSELSQELTFSEAAALYGMLDYGMRPFSENLLYVALLVLTGFFVAFATSFLLKNKI